MTCSNHISLNPTYKFADTRQYVTCEESEIIFFFQHAKTAYTAQKLAEILDIKPAKCEKLLASMVKAGKINAEVQAKVYYHARGFVL